jgi:hypothetical protein
MTVMTLVERAPRFKLRSYGQCRYASRLAFKETTVAHCGAVRSVRALWESPPGGFPAGGVPAGSG